MSFAAETLIYHELKRLRVANRFHVFEELCLDFANARLGGHFVAATGPVAGGGDQGRDFESYLRLRETLDGPATSVRAVGVCTTQEGGLDRKILSDLRKVVAGAPVEAVFVFLTADLPIARIHALQTAARTEHGVELEIFDGLRLARLLAAADLVDLAFRRLDLDSRLLPATVATDGHRPAGGGKDPQDVLAEILADGFTGRRWLVERVDAFLASRPGGFIWIEAEAGLGKTALAAHLVRERGWLSHFAHYARGGSAAVALRNLAAQLAAAHRLSLPEDVVTPEDFESLLAEAARVAVRPIVLVVDGADQGERVGDLLPWGLPRLLPEGVFVVGTYRTGAPPGHVDSPSVVLRIDAGDPRNREDLARHLDRMVERDDLAVPLAAAGVSAAEFVRSLGKRCGGVWVYLRYVLAEIRLGQRSVDDLTTLPADLGTYYARHLERWTEPGLRAFLATLAVAGEPIRVPTAAAFAGVDEDSARRWCNDILRPFLAGSAELPRRFTVLHASLREFLTGALAPDAGDAAWAWAEALQREAVLAHHRIAEHYLRAFASLADDPAMARVDDGYALRHVATHLCQAGRFADLHELLGRTRVTGDGEVENVWLAAKGYDPSGFLDDIGDAGRAAPDAGLALRYQLIGVAVDIRGYLLPGELLVALQEYGVWSADRVFANALRAPRTLGPLAPLVSRDRLPTALDAVLSIGQDWVEAEALAEMAPHLPPELLARALEHTAQMRKTDHRVTAQIGLMPYLTPTQQETTLRTLLVDVEQVKVYPGHVARVRRLAQIVDEGLIDLMARFVVLVSGLDDWRRFEILLDLVDRLPKGMNHPLLDALDISAKFDAIDRICVGATIVRERGAAQVAQALDAVLALPEPKRRVDGLVRLAPYLTRAEANRALDMATVMEPGFDRLRTIAALAGRAAPAPRTHAFALAMTDLADNLYAEDTVADLLAHTPSGPLDLLCAVVDRAKLMWHQPTAERMLRAAVAAAAPDIKGAVLDHALRAIRGQSTHQARALVDLVAVAPPERRRDLVDEALAEVLSSRFDAGEIEAVLRSIGAHAANEARATADRPPSAGNVDEALRIAREGRVGPLMRLAGRLTAPERAARVAAGVPADYDRGIALAVLSRKIPAGPRAAFVDLAMDAADRCPSAARHVILATIAPVMTEAQVARALRTLRAPGAPADAAITLAHLADHSASALEPEEILDTVAAIDEDVLRAQALAAVAPHLSAAAVDRATGLARALRHPTLQALALLRLARASARPDLAVEGRHAASTNAESDYFVVAVRDPQLSDGTYDNFADCGVAQLYRGGDLRPQVLRALGDLGSPDADAVLLEVLTRENDVTSLLRLLDAASPFLPRVIGPGGVGEVMLTLHDIRRWWP